MEIVKNESGRMRMNWETYALQLARVAALRSEDPYIQVGACVLRHNNSVVGLGYNGVPTGVNIDWSDREGRLKYVVHAEVNALRYATPGECKLLACTLSPCSSCMSVIASYGIKKIVFNQLYERDSQNFFHLAGVFGMELTHIMDLPAVSNFKSSVS